MNRAFKFVFPVMVACVTTVTAQKYDPLRVDRKASPKIVDETVRDKARKRDIPVRMYVPVGDAPSAVLLFSHGLGGTRENCTYLGKHWSSRGYVCIFLQHLGSDDSVWKDIAPARRLAAMRRAASMENYFLRVQDVPFLLDQLETWNEKKDHVLHGRLDLKRIGMSGHSFGAITTQSLAGQAAALIGQRYTDRRIKAAVLLSPSAPARGNPKTSFGSVKVPWILFTGTKDVVPIGNSDLKSRLNVYPNLPDSVDKYEVVLHNAEHSAFTDRALPGDDEPRNPNHHRVVLGLSTAFWDAQLKNDQSARDWLHGAGAKALVEKQDRWQLHTAEK